MAGSQSKITPTEGDSGRNAILQKNADDVRLTSLLLEILSNFC